MDAGMMTAARPDAATAIAVINATMTELRGPPLDQQHPPYAVVLHHQDTPDACVTALSSRHDTRYLDRET